MALKSVGARFGAPLGRLGALHDRSSETARDASATWRAWYKTARWQKLRWQVLIDSAFRCAVCGWQHSLAVSSAALVAVGRADLVVGKAPELVADHKIAHRGDETLFWARGNLQCLCKGCHDGAKQKAERGGGV